MSVLMPQIRAANTPPQLPTLTADVFDLDSVLPLNIIRQHTKTDDVPSVTDELLRIYRSAAFAAAEQYTGLLFRAQRIITQDVDAPHNLIRFKKPYYTVTLDFPTADGVLYLYGGKQALTVQTITTTPGATKVKLPINHYAIDLHSCCAPACGKGPLNYGMSLMYKAGVSCAEAIPQCVVMGALKYIAWTVTNPGDEALSPVNMNNVNPQASRNNTAWQSGAIEEWRICMPDAV